MKAELTKREGKVLDWVKDFQQEFGGYPTYREIQDAFEFNSINSVSQYVKQLARKGYLELLKNRGYRLVADERTGMVTMSLLGSVQAGGPNTTQEASETMTLPRQFVPSPQRSFLLRVRGNSMSDAGIHEDDIMIVNSEKKPQVGDIVVALLDGETTVKRLAVQRNKRYLKAENKAHPNIYPEAEWEIQGVVTGLWRSY
ncbi:MAG: transcriptional repressor LexA [bacterium]|nr:transcriptional repressor LexA [bacterium]